MLFSCFHFPHTQILNSTSFWSSLFLSILRFYNGYSRIKFLYWRKYGKFLSSSPKRVFASLFSIVLTFREIPLVVDGNGFIANIYHSLLSKKLYPVFSFNSIMSYVSRISKFCRSHNIRIEAFCFDCLDESDKLLTYLSRKKSKHSQGVKFIDQGLEKTCMWSILHFVIL